MRAKTQFVVVLLGLLFSGFMLQAQDKRTVTGVIKDTVKELQERVAKGAVSPMYCDLKKKIIQQQADILAKSVQGRF